MSSKLALVLAGGLSRRFGEDKVYAKLKDKTLIEEVVERLRAARFEVILSVSQSKTFPIRSAILQDPFPFQGPLQALYGALSQLNCERLLLVAADMPLIQPSVLEKLWEASEGFCLTLLEFEGKLFPLPGVYDKKILPWAKALLNEGKRDLKSLFTIEPRRVVTWREWRLLDPKALTLGNINTEAELKGVSQQCSII